MPTLRRAILLIALLVMGVCIVLLLNITASHPTGRRYSSAPIVIAGDSQAIGASGEQVLAADLRAPNNNDADQRQCVCNSAAPMSTRECRVCIADVPTVTTYRIPDFVTDRYLAESKNRRIWDNSDVAQITDYAAAARALSVPLWVYVRVDSWIDPVYRPIIEATGGGIVPYFVPPDYIDPVDAAAWRGLIGGSVIAALMIAWGRIARPPRPRIPTPPTGTIRDAEAFLRTAQDRAREVIDREDVRL
jgi:hypothetical protein